MQHLKKLIRSFYKDHSDKPIATFEVIDTAPLMARPTVQSIATATALSKQKRGHAANSPNKQTKKS